MSGAPEGNSSHREGTASRCRRGEDSLEEMALKVTEVSGAKGVKGLGFGGQVTARFFLCAG